MAADGIPAATLGFVSFHAFHVSLKIAGGDECPASIHLLRKLLMRSVFLVALFKTVNTSRAGKKAVGKVGRSCLQNMSMQQASRGPVAVTRKAHVLRLPCLLQPQTWGCRRLTLWGCEIWTATGEGKRWDCARGEQIFPTCLMHISYPAPCSLTSLHRSAVAPCHLIVEASLITAATLVRAPGLQQSTGKAEEAGTSCSSQAAAQEQLYPRGDSCMCIFTRRGWSQECQSTQAVCSPAAGQGPREESLQFCGLVWILVNLNPVSYQGRQHSQAGCCALLCSPAAP